MLRRDFLRGALIATLVPFVPGTAESASAESDTATQIDPDVQWATDPIYVTYVVRKNGRVVTEKRDIRK